MTPTPMFEKYEAKPIDEAFTTAATYRPPSPWAHRIAMVLGGFCLIGGLALHMTLSEKKKQLASATALHEYGGDQQAVDVSPVSLSLSGLKILKASIRQRSRQRLGLVLAGIVLLVGGYLAAGIHKIYTKLIWYEEQAADTETHY